VKGQGHDEVECGQKTFVQKMYASGEGILVDSVPSKTSSFHFFNF